MRNRICLKISAFSFLLFVLLISLRTVSEAQIGCGFQADAAWQQRIASFKKTDTLRTLAIWAVANNPPVATDKKRPVFWRQMWDSSQTLSVPRFYLENSDRKYILNVDTLSVPDSFCIRSSFNPVGFSGGRDFTRDVLTRADSFVNFANYDRDGDKIIQDGIFICIAYDTAHLGTDILGLTGGGSLDTFVTKDSVGGVPIKIVSNSGVTLRAPSQNQAVQLASHEWGHLFGLRDYFAKTSSDWWSSGSFSVMGYTGFQYRASPFSPFQNHKFIGWKQPIDVNATSYAQQIGNYMSTKQFYRLRRTSTGPDTIEYFEASYHSQGQQGSSTWEQNWPGQGVLVAHIVDTVVSPQSKAVKQFDLEVPGSPGNYGLRDTSGGIFLATPNDSTGADSLDLFLPYWNKDTTYRAAGSATCLWNSSTKRYFDDKTNPSSRVYQGTAQKVFSRLAIEDIKINAATASADLLLNAQYGRIAGKNTLGPGIVPVVGDLIVDSGDTLTLAAGTTLKMQANYDNQVLGPGNDAAKCKVWVKRGGKLNAVGTSTNPIKILSSLGAPSDTDWTAIRVDTGGSASLKYLVIKNANRGVVYESTLAADVMENVHIESCKVVGIAASDAPNLEIRNCGVAFVGASNGIRINPGSQDGCKLVGDTVRSCFNGIYILNSADSVKNCIVLGPGHVGIFVGNQASAFPNLPVPIVNTTVQGYFDLAHVQLQHDGRAELSQCKLLSSASPLRSPYCILVENVDHILKVRRSKLTNWGKVGINVATGAENPFLSFNLGTEVPLDSGNNSILNDSTPDTSWKYVYNDSAGNPLGVKAELNCWGHWCGQPLASRFAGYNIDYDPWLPSIVDPGPKITAGRGVLPKHTELYQNYPNPFNPTTQIQFNLEKTQKVWLEVFNILGQKVKTFLNGEEFSAGLYTFRWNGRDDDGNALSSGVYLYRLKTDSYLETKKMSLVK